MRIVIVSTLQPPEHGGGIATYGRNLAESLAADGHHVRILCYTKGTERVELVNGVEIHRFRHRHLPLLESRFPGLAWSWFVRQTLIKWHNAAPLDVVEFSNWEGAGLMTSWLPRKFPVVTRLVTPYFESLNIASATDLKWSDRFICWMEEKTVRTSDKLITSTKHHARMMAESYGLNVDNITVVPLGIELPARPAQPAPAPEGKPVQVLYVSRLELRKGTLTLLEAIPAVLRKLPLVQFTLIGPDRPHAPGNRLFKDYFAAQHPELTSQVSFQGFLSDEEVTAAYAGCDVFVVPSKYESFGLIYVEAMAWGKPVIGCSAGGIPEVIKAPETGFLTAPDDHEDLAAKLETLCRDSALRVQMGKAARQWTEERFDRRVMTAETLQAYQLACSGFSPVTK